MTHATAILGRSEIAYFSEACFSCQVTPQNAVYGRSSLCFGTQAHRSVPSHPLLFTLPMNQRSNDYLLFT